MPETPDSVLQSLAEVVKGLNYPSESDEPFDVIHWPARDGTSAKEAVLMHWDRKRKLEQVAVQSFFAQLADADDAGRFQNLRRLLENHLKELAIIRAGVGEVEVDIYALGRLPGGDWAGVHTRSVET